jgi:hypothetical protein
MNSETSHGISDFFALPMSHATPEISSPKKPLVIRHENVKDSTVGYPKLPQLKKHEKTSIEMGRLDLWDVGIIPFSSGWW